MALVCHVIQQNGWKLLKVSHHPTKFSGIGNIMILAYHVILQ